MCSNFLDVKSTLAKKITTKFYFFSYFGIFFQFILFVTFFQSCYLIFHTQKVSTHYQEQNKKRTMTICYKTKKLFKVIKCQKNAQKTQNFSCLKYIKVLEFLKTLVTFLNKDTKH